MPIPAGLTPSQTYKMKLNRVVVVANIDSSYSSLLFAIIYLLYPGTSKGVFEIFRCHSVQDGLSLLEADYTIECWVGLHLVAVAFGALCVLLYPVGIPLYLGRQMWRNKAQIRANRGSR
jgi:hypothetical protein